MIASRHSWDVAQEEPGGTSRAALPGAIVWLLLVWLYWFETGRETLGATLGGEAPPRAVLFAAAGGVIARIGAELVETGFYAALWRAFGRPLRFAPLFVAIVSLSLLDVVSVSLLQWAGDAPPAWLVPLTGFQAWPGALAGQPGLRLGFGGLGLLTLARILGTAHALKPAGSRFGPRLGLVGATWLAGRLATWWTTDLLRGMSPLP